MRANAASPGNAGASAGAGSTLAQRHSLRSCASSAVSKNGRKPLASACSNALTAAAWSGPWLRRRTGTTAFIGLAQGLPIHRDDAPGSAEIQTVADRTDKAGERLGEFGGVEQAEHPAETIMAGRTMRQLDDLGQLGRVDRPEVGDVDTALLAAQRCRQRDEQDGRQLMARIGGARIAHLAQDRQHRLHRGSPKPGNPSQNQISSRWQQPVFTNAIPLHVRGASIDLPGYDAG